MAIITETAGNELAKNFVAPTMLFQFAGHQSNGLLATHARKKQQSQNMSREKKKNRIPDSTRLASMQQ